MAEHLGKAILKSLQGRRKAATKQRSSQAISAAIATWFDDSRIPHAPWLKVDTRWLAVLGELLFDRVPAELSVRAWPLIGGLRTPKKTLTHLHELKKMAACLGREAAAKHIEKTAQWFVENPTAFDSFDELVAAPHVDSTTAAIAMHAVSGGGGEPVLATNAIMRVVTRVSGDPDGHRNRATDGRMALAALIGFGDHSNSAYLGLVDISRSVCRPRQPCCRECPLTAWCATGAANRRRQPVLF
jgi:DNA (cytosine-5)-methyltransferase 1